MLLENWKVCLHRYGFIQYQSCFSMLCQFTKLQVLSRWVSVSTWMKSSLSFSVSLSPQCSFDILRSHSLTFLQVWPSKIYEIFRYANTMFQWKCAIFCIECYTILFSLSLCPYCNLLTSGISKDLKPNPISLKLYKCHDITNCKYKELLLS